MHCLKIFQARYCSLWSIYNSQHQSGSMVTHGTLYKTQSGLPQRGKAKPFLERFLAYWRHLCTHINWKGHKNVSQTAYRPSVFFM